MSDTKNESIKSEETEDQKKIVEQFKVTLKLARIGEHFLNFIIQCRKIKAPPMDALQILKDIKSGTDSKLPNATIPVPIICLVDWINDPTEEHFQTLQKSLGVKIDKIVEEELASKQKMEEKTKE